MVGRRTHHGLATGTDTPLDRLSRRCDAWPVVHPLFVALDLSLDRARGVEILRDWTPPAPFERVWWPPRASCSPVPRSPSRVIVERFVDGEIRVVRYLKTYGDPGWPSIDADDIRRVVGPFTSRLRT